MAIAALALAACAPVDDSIGSRLTQPPPGTPPQKPVDEGDIAIVGQEVSHAIMDLPVIANATVPPMVQFTGVTSIVDKPVDTDPYTELLRDRLLLITREKLRFVEHTLPPLVTAGKKGKKHEPAPTPESATPPDYQVLAELRGHYGSDFYKIQVEFVDIHSGEVLFNGLYRIRKEAEEQDYQAPDSVPAPPGNSPDAVPPTTQDPSAPPPESGSNVL